TAILSAIRYAGKHDVILLAGKGHEDYQEVKGRRLAFRDAVVTGDQSAIVTLRDGLAAVRIADEMIS
ncbi:MAG: hypothetical protein EBY07_17475, partial [Actinobacteria bacterium]|nr:hypothetical protein [Actinomycetota bacterium]